MTGPGSAVTKKGWMQGSSTSLRGVLLGLALERPGHGYELANRLDDRLGNTWLIVRKDIYRLLEALEREDLLSVSEERKAGRRRPLLVYHPTELTADALTEWMDTLIPKEPMRVSGSAYDCRSSLLQQQASPRGRVCLLTAHATP
jgi:DNA-binding PadR family transcriptional regulator